MTLRVTCYIDAERSRKTSQLLRSFTEGCGGKIVRHYKMDSSADEHVVVGHWSGTAALIPQFLHYKVPFWHLDNGWLTPDPHGSKYYRATWKGLAPCYLPDRPLDRAEWLGIAAPKPWRRSGRSILVCLQSERFGSPFNLCYESWVKAIEYRLRAVTDRPIVIRAKPPRRAYNVSPTFEEQLADAWCLVTHSSGTAVKAALAGVPVFCDPICGAAPVGCTDFSRIETPSYPENRLPWISSLTYQQFTRAEFRSGFAWETLSCIREAAVAA